MQIQSANVNAEPEMPLLKPFQAYHLKRFSKEFGAQSRMQIQIVNANDNFSQHF